MQVKWIVAIVVFVVLLVAGVVGAVFGIRHHKRNKLFDKIEQETGCKIWEFTDKEIKELEEELCKN